MEKNSKSLSFRRKLFGSEIEIILYDVDSVKAKKIIEKAYKYAMHLQKIFNFYDENSELSKLNKIRSMELSNDLLEVITKSIFISKKTHGSYDISLGKAIKQRKESKSQKKLSCSYKDIKIQGNIITLMHPEVLIDLGSIAKGCITDKIGEFLIANSINNFMINSRGDILVSGNAGHLIQVQHPRSKKSNLGTISLFNEAVATSGDYNQFYGSFEKSHILNKKSIISATVIAPTLEEADIYATALFVCSNKDKKNLLLKNNEIKAMLVDKNLKRFYYNGFKEAFYGKKLQP